MESFDVVGGVPVASSPAALTSLPRFLRLGPNLLAVQFSLMKLLPAEALVSAAPAGAPLIETTSGTMGIALAIAAAHHRRNLTLVTPVLDEHTRDQLLALGCTRLVEVAGDQLARLDELRAVMDDNRSLHWTNQYGDPLVASAYAPAGDQLARLGVNLLVTPVGSGGSARGMIEPLRRSRPDARLIAVDAMNSVLFGRPNGDRRTPGIGSSIVPEQLDRSAFDQVHWLTDPAIWSLTSATARNSGLFIGPTGAASLHVARWHAARSPGSLVAAVVPDEGHRYLTSAYRAAPTWEPRAPLELGLEEATSFACAENEPGWITCPWPDRRLA